MTNYRSDQQNELDIFVNKISVASKLYEVRPLITQDTDHAIEDKRSNMGHSIGWREQVTLHYLISPIIPRSSKCVISECSLGKTASKQINDGSKITNFICLEYAHDTFKVTNVMS